LAWIDEEAALYSIVQLENPKVVTKFMSEINFMSAAKQGDIVEIGLPFSDPMADGLVIQRSSSVALNEGMTLRRLFDELEGFRYMTSAPVVLMGYVNQFMCYGPEKFLKRCAELGVDGLLFPDLPMEVYLNEYENLFRYYGIQPVFMITPQSDDFYIKKIDEQCSSFLYAVSGNSITGKNTEIGKGQLSYLHRLSSLKTKNPVLCGFGIADKKVFNAVCSEVNGAVIGSAFIRAQEEKRESLFLEELLS
ncbi:MAG: tryptophan synthase subunit alpha, partial [Flavobacteriales bacterium]